VAEVGINPHFDGYHGGNVKSLRSGFYGQMVRTSPIQVIGWWGLFDAGEVWECGAAFLTNLYGRSSSAPFAIPNDLLQQPANQSAVARVI